MSWKTTLLIGDPAECRAYAKRRMLRAYEYKIVTRIEDIQGFKETKAIELWGFHQIPDIDKIIQYAEHHDIKITH